MPTVSSQPTESFAPTIDLECIICGEGRGITMPAGEIDIVIEDENGDPVGTITITCQQLDEFGEYAFSFTGNTGVQSFVINCKL